MCAFTLFFNPSPVLEITTGASSPRDALAGLLELLYPPTTFLPDFSLRLDNLAGVAHLAAALKASAVLHQCAAARDALGVVPAAWEAGYADEGDPRYLLNWLKDAETIPGKTGRLERSDVELTLSAHDDRILTLAWG